MESMIEKVLENVSEIEAFQEETRLIKLYGRIDDKTGSLVNVTDGGDGCSGFHQSNQHIQKRVVKQVGKRRTEEQKQRMRGKRKSSDKIKAAALKRANMPEEKQRVSNQFKGKSVPAERRDKISLTMKLKGLRPPISVGDNHPRAKSGLILLPSGEIVSFLCLVSFCKEQSLNVSSVRNTLAKGKPLKRGKFAGLQLLSREVDMKDQVSQVFQMIKNGKKEFFNENQILACEFLKSRNLIQGVIIENLKGRRFQVFEFRS